MIWKFNLRSIECTPKTLYLMLKLMKNFIDFCENICSFCNGYLQRVLKKLEQGQKKRLGKLMNAQRAPVWNIPQVNKLIANRWVSWLGVKEASPKGSAVEQRWKDGSKITTWWITAWENSLHRKQFQNNVSQSLSARNLGIYSSTVHNIIQRFRKSEEL